MHRDDRSGVPGRTMFDIARIEKQRLRIHIGETRRAPGGENG
jgi:hypothetical protein